MAPELVSGEGYGGLIREKPCALVRRTVSLKCGPVALKLNTDSLAMETSIVTMTRDDAPYLSL